MWYPSFPRLSKQSKIFWPLCGPSCTLGSFAASVLTNFPCISDLFHSAFWFSNLKTRRYEAARLLGSWVRIPPGAWAFVCCECCVFWGRGLCDELATRPEESYRLPCIVVSNQETSWMKSHTQSVVIELNMRLYITGCISYIPLTFRHRASCI